MNQTRKIVQKGVPIHEESTRDKLLGSRRNQNGLSSLDVIDLQQSLNGSHLRIRFNADRKFYTSTFIIQEQESIYISNDSILRQNFKRKMGESNSIKPTIHKPKPLLSYCQICKESYSDYQKHIIHPIHKKKIAAATADSYIHDLCYDFKSKKRALQVDTEKEALLKSNKPRKLIKLEDPINSLKASSNMLPSNNF